MSCWVGVASAQLAGQDFLVGLDRVRARYRGAGAVAGAGIRFDHRETSSPLFSMSVADDAVRAVRRMPRASSRNTLQGLRVGSSISCPRVDGHLFQTCLFSFSAPQQGWNPWRSSRERHPRSREVGTPVFLASARSRGVAPPLIASGDTSVQLDIRRNPSGEPPRVRRAGPPSTGHPRTLDMRDRRPPQSATAA